MKEWQYNEIISYMRDWIKEEGLCRFCDDGRRCLKSRRGRQECPRYRFANEMDCFHLWIACFDNGVVFRAGYDDPDSYPWMNEPPAADIPPGSPKTHPSDAEMSRKVKIKQLKKRKNILMQEINNCSHELEKVESEIKLLETTKECMV